LQPVITPFSTKPEIVDEKKQGLSGIDRLTLSFGCSWMRMMVTKASMMHLGSPASSEQNISAWLAINIPP
jgi:hypothetical protein